MPEVPAQIGSCVIQREIGRGGMGVVYLARDTELDREVAIKVLPEELARDEIRRKRFERESKLLGSLHHSNIAAVYGLEQVDGRPFLMMEYVAGQTLRARLEKGSVPVEESMRIAVQIARALEAAHARGIVHRDLKPSNVKFGADGTVKVLDFGLAKDVDPMSLGTTEVEGEHTTATGVVVGTPGYMSPEQTRSQEVDQRTDIWAFGCVLYEMLTGRTAFSSESGTDAIASVLREDPDWDALPGRIPPNVRWLLQRCLEKDPDRRVHHIADARIELEEALADPRAGARSSLASEPATPAASAPGLAWSLVGLALVSTALAVWGWSRPTAAAAASPTRLEIAPPPDQQFVDAAISPDGRTLAYAARPARFEGPTQLYLRSLETWEVREVPRSAGASNLFFDPAGVWIGFFNGSSLQRVRVSGGQPEKICDTGGVRMNGATWVPDRGAGEIIVFAQPSTGLHRVSAEGGRAEQITQLLPDQTSHWGPEYVGGDTILFSIRDGTDSALQALDLETDEFREIKVAESDPLEVRYLPTGHLLYAQADGLWLVRFDVDRLEATSPPIRAVPDVGFNLYQSPVFSVSATGTLVYIPGSGTFLRSRLVQVDREENITVLHDPVAHYIWPNVSPDGEKLAYQTQDGDLWVLDLRSRTEVVLTAGGTNIWPVWDADSAAVTFGSNRYGPLGIFRTPADGSATVADILTGPPSRGPNSWSPDGSTLGFVEINSRSGLDLWTRTAGVDHPLATSRANESMLAFSLDGRWLAYVSDASGHDQVLVAPRSGEAPAVQVSVDGGTEPVWSSGALFYRNGSQLWTVDSPSDRSTPDWSGRHLVFDSRDLYPSGYNFPNYDVFPDGQSFVFVDPEEETAPPLRVALDWFAGLRERLDGGK